MNLTTKTENRKKDFIYESVKELPEDVREFVVQHKINKPLYNFEDDKIYCSFCLSELKSKGNCTCCGKKYGDYINVGDVDISRDINKYECVVEEDINNLELINFLFFFQKTEEKVLLYVIRETINYMDEKLIKKPVKELCIYNVYSIENNFMKELTNNDVICYEGFKNNSFKNNDENPTICELDCSGYLYTDNLEDLKGTIYKDSGIWDGKEFLKDNEVSIKGITYFPICLPMFKYLMKNKLSNLAFDSSDVFKKNRSFKETFEVNKKFLPFMQKHNSSKEMIKAIRLCNTTDIDILSHALGFIDFSFFSDLKELVKLVSLEEVYKYLNKIGLGYKDIHFYIRYIEALKKNKMDINSKEVLFPKDLLLECSKLGISLDLSWTDRD